MPDYPTMVKEIEEVSSDLLSERECEFIEDMMGKQTFTTKQGDWIQAIYTRLCDTPF